jgi:hypothetical protein
VLKYALVVRVFPDVTKIKETKKKEREKERERERDRERKEGNRINANDVDVVEETETPGGCPAIVALHRRFNR